MPGGEQGRHQDTVDSADLRNCNSRPVSSGSIHTTHQSRSALRVRPTRQMTAQTGNIGDILLSLLMCTAVLFENNAVQFQFEAYSQHILESDSGSYG
jgi:hypothetical protein